jgi:ubiquinone/menaquinone biosynthesis C-methylase UbiE
MAPTSPTGSARSAHDDLVRRSFARQVDLFEGEDSVFKQRASSIEWTGDLDPEWIALDVACGAAHNAQAVAPHVRQVVGLDVTPEVLEAGRRRLLEDGVLNVLLQEGDAAAMPFVDGSFDLVVCRASLHHFDDPTRQMREIARVCREGGRVVITDMVPVPVDLRDRFDQIHRWIDPSHNRVLAPGEITALVAGEVGRVGRDRVGQRTVLPLAAILTEQSDTDRVVGVLRAELDGGDATGFHPAESDDGSLTIAVTTMVVHAEREAA